MRARAAHATGFVYAPAQISREAIALYMPISQLLYFSLTSCVSVACPGKDEKDEYRFRMSKSVLLLLRTSRA